MITYEADIAIVGAGPVGLMCALLAHRCGLKAIVVDRSDGPLEVGRADALNARSLQLIEMADLFDELYRLGKPCSTSSVWSQGKFLSRQSTWWDELEGCFHKHFLMLGQSFLEQALDRKLSEANQPVLRSSEVKSIEASGAKCRTLLASGDLIHSQFVIGADGSRSLVRSQFGIDFEINKPEIVWAVIDGTIVTDFPKVPEIIVFQGETSEVAWIPREGEIDRFYVRMDKKNFEITEAIAKIERAVRPHQIVFSKIVWSSQFSVKESVAEKFFAEDRIFLAGDACHIHSVNGGQGLNTGLGDAFNLIWKLNMVLRFGAPTSFLKSYEGERKPVAISVVETSAELVRSTRFSEQGTHAQDYVKILQRRSGHITGMGIRYGDAGPVGERLFDFEVHRENVSARIYSFLNYAKFTLLIFSNELFEVKVPDFVQVLRVSTTPSEAGVWTASDSYRNLFLLVRPDSYVLSVAPLERLDSIFEELDQYLEKV